MNPQLLRKINRNLEGIVVSMFYGNTIPTRMQVSKIVGAITSTDAFSVSSNYTFGIVDNIMERLNN